MLTIVLLCAHRLTITEENKMYQVIAKFHDFKGKQIQPIYIAKTYKNKKSAEKFVEGQKNHPKFYFEIVAA